MLVTLIVVPYCNREPLLVLLIFMMPEFAFKNPASITVVILMITALNMINFSSHELLWKFRIGFVFHFIVSW